MLPAYVAPFAAALAERYSLRRVLGVGGMATVWLAEDVRHRRLVAVKALHPELSAALGPERFQREIELTANLQHPHILPLFDSGSAAGLLYYVMPFVDGETLRARVEREGPLPVSDAVRLATDVAEALHYAHERGVIHRDVKPENILLQDGRALVADFGVALAVQQAGGTRMTQTGLSLGTPAYMAPEQAMAERTIDARADVYALGAVAYELLTGRPPFTGPSGQAVVARTLTEAPRPLREWRASTPASLEAAILTALAKLPADRFATARAFADALRSADAAEALAIASPWRSPNGSSGVGPPATRLRWLPWGITALALALATGVAVRPSEPSVPRLVAALSPPPGEAFGEDLNFLQLSPDGRRTAAATTSPRGERRLWITNLATGEQTLVPGSIGAAAPFWSPDGRVVAWFADGRLHRAGADGGDRRILATVPDGRGGAWSSRGDVLYSDGSRLHVLPESGGTPRVVWPIDSVHPVWRPQWLPDGTRFVFTAGSPGAWWIGIGDLGDGRVRVLTREAREAVFVPPDRLLMLANVRGHPMVVQRLDLATGALTGERLSVGGALRYGAHSATATHLAYLPAREGQFRSWSMTDDAGLTDDTLPGSTAWMVRQAHRAPLVALGGVGLSVYDLQTRRSERWVADARATHVAWSRDDARLAYLRSTAGRCDVHIRDLNSGRDTLLVARRFADGCLHPTDWTPDGRNILARHESGAGFAFVDVSAGTVTPILDGTDGGNGRLSHDGRWLAYENDRTGAPEIYVRALDGTTERRVSVDGGGHPLWAEDGRLYFLSPDGRVLRTRPDASGRIPTPELRFRRTGASRPDQLDMNADGSRFILSGYTVQSPSAVLVQGWLDPP